MLRRWPYRLELVTEVCMPKQPASQHPGELPQPQPPGPDLPPVKQPSEEPDLDPIKPVQEPMRDPVQRPATLITTARR
jgi:hypothetical protein